VFVPQPTYEQLAELVVGLAAENKLLKERIAELERQLGRNSRNSSTPAER